MPGPLKNFDDRRKYANAMREVYSQRARQLADDLASGEIDLITWHIEMRELVRDSHRVQFVIGKGIPDEIEFGEYGRLGPVVRKQYEYLNRFAREIEDAQMQGKPTAFIQNRAVLYMRSSQQSFWHSAVPVQLPQVPRDGQTICRTNCKCRLDIQYVFNSGGEQTAVQIFWRLSPAEHCQDCLHLARTWNPLEFALGNEQVVPDILLREQAVWLMYQAEKLEPDFDLLEFGKVLELVA